MTVKTLQFIKDALSTISRVGHTTGYDWNADPEGLTRFEGDVFTRLDEEITRKQKHSQVSEPAVYGPFCDHNCPSDGLCPECGHGAATMEGREKMIDLDCKECGGGMQYEDEYEEEGVNSINGNYQHIKITIWRCGDCGWQNEEIRDLNLADSKERP